MPCRVRFSVARQWKTAIGKRRETRPAEIIQFDQAMFETKLDTVVREKVERIVNAMPDASGGRDRQRSQIRVFSQVVTFLNSNMWYVTNLPGKNAECLCHGDNARILAHFRIPALT